MPLELLDDSRVVITKKYVASGGDGYNYLWKALLRETVFLSSVLFKQLAADQKPTYF